MTKKISLTDDATLGPQTKWFKAQALKSDTDVFINPKTAKLRIDEITKVRNKSVERQIRHNLQTNEYSYHFNALELAELHSLLSHKGLTKLRNTLSKARARFHKKKIAFQCNLPADEVELINDIVRRMNTTREQFMSCIAHADFDRLQALLDFQKEDKEATH